HAMAVLDSLLKSLPVTDRVHLFAVDVQAEALMAGFDGPQSDAVRAAREALESRIPLGATNMQAAIKAGLNAKIEDR
ncbi:hypothetical protein, partial [Streptomyces galilaeus]|uniref:hypothetical protein n=1 Tax=Streptomyces galilaeus TaxID=33899 RepID=UPI0038F799A5